MKITLEALKELVNANTPATCEIDTVYIDYGADWKERTLVAKGKDGYGTYHMLYLVYKSRRI